ncbi:hypothetical protein MY148_17090 [Leptospira borgpetersenii]|nr:hypothetical protein MY148_17090 [Leptospira borgpetersenii]
MSSLESGSGFAESHPLEIIKSMLSSASLPLGKARVSISLFD